MRDFKKLDVWARAHSLTIRVYQTTRSFPREEIYGLTSQMRRCCSSVPANIAEGCGRSGVAEFAHFLNIAMGSSSELEYHLLLANDLGLLSQEDYNELYTEVTGVKRMLTALHKQLKG